MADLAIRLVVFIASPNDLNAERAIVEEEVRATSRYGRQFGVQLEAFRWEDGVTPGSERRLQERFTRELRDAELTIVLFWYRLGSAANFVSDEKGSIEELRVARERVAAGHADDVFVYFKLAPPPEGASPGDVEDVARLRQQLDSERQLLVGHFHDGEELRARLRSDLTRWSQRWFRMREVCTYLLRGMQGATVPAEVLGEARLTRLLPAWEHLATPQLEASIGGFACQAYQAQGPAAFRLPLPARLAAEVVGEPAGAGVFSRFRRAAFQERAFSEGDPFEDRSGNLYFGTQEWFFFCCALGLIEAIRENRVDAVSTVPYLNPVHQFLAALTARRNLVEMLAPTLRRWLLNAGNVTAGRPVARNFAAYVLGMIGAAEAQDDLADALRHDRGEGVRTYCITSLGKLRARRHLPTLLRAFDETADTEERALLAQSLCRMTGLVQYEL